jgi:hypothetical protein
MRQELEDFRTEFAPIRDFLGNDLETFMADPPQERIDSALARYLPAFRGQTSLQVSGQAPQIFFPECSKHVEELVVWCADQELSSSEAKEVKDSVAALLSYKVLNLQRTRATGFAPHVRPVLRRCSEYLEEARLLKGGEPSVFDLVLWERVASALEDPRATELQSKVKAVIELALSDETYAQQLSRQDLGILASELSDTYQFAEAQKLFDVVLRVGNADGADSAASLPSRYLGQFGRGFCLGSLARDAMSQGRKDAALEYLVEADYAFNRAYGLLSSLPDQSSDKRAKLATLYMALAKIQLAYWSLNENPVHLAQIRAAHEQARDLASGPRLTRAIAVDLCNLGEFELAAAELSKALEVASYLASDLMPMRARCFAILGNEEKLLNDVLAILAKSTSTDRAEEVEPKDLATSALALAEYIDAFGDRVSSEKERWYFETMKKLLAGVKERCASGVPYTLAQLNLDTEFFTPLKEYDPAFWDDYVRSVSRNAIQSPRRKKETTTLISLAVLPWRACCNAVIGQEREMLGDVETVLSNARVAHLAWMVGPADLNRCALALAVYLSRKDAQISAEKREWYLEKMKQLLTEAKQRCSSGFDYTLDQLELDSDYFHVLKDHDPAFWDDYSMSVSSSAIHPQARKPRKANTVVEPQAVEGR